MQATVVVSKADNATQEIVIHIEGAIPADLHKSLGVIRAWFETQAATLELALYETLPGGTYDRLLALMLQRKASLLVISHKL